MSLAASVLFAQLGVTLLASAAFGLHAGHWGVSALAGGLVCMAGVAWQARVLLRAPADESREPAGSAEEVATTAGLNMVRSEVGKWLLTLALFVVVFGTYRDVEIVPLVVTFGLCQLCFVLAPLAGRRRRRR